MFLKETEANLAQTSRRFWAISRTPGGSEICSDGYEEEILCTRGKGFPRPGPDPARSQRRRPDLSRGSGGPRHSILSNSQASSAGRAAARRECSRDLQPVSSPG